MMVITATTDLHVYEDELVAGGAILITKNDLLCSGYKTEHIQNVKLTLKGCILHLNKPNLSTPPSQVS
jgi:hypothetical protein